MFWPHNSALLNATNAKTLKKNSTMNVGEILLQFPLEKKHHIGRFGFKYEVSITSSEIFQYNNTTNNNYCTIILFEDLTKEIVGDSRVVYDDKKIIEGNFTRKFSVYENNFIDDAIDLTLQNKILPLGIRYLHRVNNESHVATASLPNIVRTRILRKSKCDVINYNNIPTSPMQFGLNYIISGF